MQLVKQSDQTALLHSLLSEQNRKAMVKAAPRSIGDADRLLRIAFNAVVYDDKLSECLLSREGQASILGGIMEALKLGITIGGPMQEGWLLPFRIHGNMKAQLIIGYQGYRNIIDRSRAVLDFVPRAVHVKDADNFDYELGSRAFVRFKPRHQQPLTKEELYCVFGIANLRGGGQQIDVLWPDEVEAHRNRSRAKESGPWVTDYVPMAMKTVVRKMAKYLPKSNELLNRALDLDNRADSGVEQDFGELAEGVVLPEQGVKPVVGPSGALGALKEKIGATPKPEAQSPEPGANAPGMPTAEDIFGG